MRLFEAFGKLGALLLQISPAFSPKAHQLSELEAVTGAVKNYRVAIELRNRNWVEGEQLAETLRFFREHALTFVAVDAPARNISRSCRPNSNEVTNPGLAYLRLHGRDAKAYTTGKTVASRFNYDYSDEEIEEVAERSSASRAKRTKCTSSLITMRSITRRTPLRGCGRRSASW